MSAIAYSQPHKLPAGILAVAVHCAFFVLLYFGVHWQAQPPMGMVVDIWESLPEAKDVRVNDPPPEQQPEPPKVEPPKAPELPKQEPPKRVEPPKVVEPKVQPKAEIELKDAKKPKKIEAAKPDPMIKEAERKAQAEKEAQAERIAQAEKRAQERRAHEERGAQTQRDAQAEQERERAEQAAAYGRVINEYVGKIRAKIKRNIVEPRDLPATIHGKFNITVLPGGSVLNVKLVKSSGNEAYDSAVERAILKAQPLPVPEDVTLFQKFREINFPFCPDKGGGTCEE